MRWIVCVLLSLFCYGIGLSAVPIYNHSHYPISLHLKSLTKHLFVSLQLGQLISESGSEQTLFFSPVNYNLYNPDKKARSTFDYSLGFGVYNDLSPRLRLLLGIAFAQTLNQSVSGTVYQYTLFPNLKYQYDVRNTRVMFTTRWSYEVNQDWRGFLDFDLGVAHLIAANYKETPLIEQSLANPAFKSSDTDGFTYQLGGGLSYTNQHLPDWQWSVGAAYLRLPKNAALGPAPLQTTNDRLALGNVSGTRIWLGVRYFFENE